MDDPSTEDAALPTAYCAPGQKVIAAIALALQGEAVREVIEHPWLVAGDDVFLMAPVEEIPLEVPEWRTVLPHCGICDGILPYHGPLCLTRLSATSPPPSLIVGLTV